MMKNFRSSWRKDYVSSLNKNTSFWLFRIIKAKNTSFSGSPYVWTCDVVETICATAVTIHVVLHNAAHIKQ